MSQRARGTGWSLLGICQFKQKHTCTYLFNISLFFNGQIDDIKSENLKVANLRLKYMLAIKRILNSLRLELNVARTVQIIMIWASATSGRAAKV